MGLFQLHLAQNGRKPARERKPKFTEKNFESQVKGRLLSAYFSDMKPDEASKFGRALMTRILGDTADPEAALKAELFESDSEFRSEFRDLLLEEKRARIDQMRKKKQNRDDDDYEDPMSMFGRELIMEAIEKGRRGGGMMEHMMGALAQVLPAILAMQQGQSVAIATPQPEQLEAPEQQALQEGEPMQRKLLDTFTATDIQQLLAIEDVDQAGRIAAQKIHDAIDAMPQDKQAGSLMALESALSAPPAFLLIYLGGFKGDPLWKPVVSYLEQHKDHLEKLQAAIKTALNSDPEEDAEEEDGPE